MEAIIDIEEKASAELCRAREREEGDTHRELKHHHHHHHRHDGRRHDRHHDERHHKKHHLKVRDGTEHGMMIDAGSQGTRIHVYEFEARVLSTRREVEDVVAGEKLSIPTTDTRWTDRLKPGLDSFAFIEDPDEMIVEVTRYLNPLFEFAKTVLVGKKGHWGKYPIYLKATGGLRTLPRPYRVRLIAAVRATMHNESVNPFLFENEYVALTLWQSALAETNAVSHKDFFGSLYSQKCARD